MYAVAYDDGLEVRNYIRARNETHLAEDVRSGLTAEQKRIPSKYFYDAYGSKLFEQICELPEYYPTRTEMALLREHAHTFMNGFDNGDLVELGSGANWKVRTLLEALTPSCRACTRYVPVDVSESALLEASRELLRIHPEMQVFGVVADFTKDLHELPRDRTKLILFLGSTIGNLDDDESRTFLHEVSRSMNPGDRFLLGMDMVKSTDVLEAAYNDAQGVTAAFNKNVLSVINRELAANFDLDSFDHLAFFNEDEERIEMHLRAARSMTVEIGEPELFIEFDEGETIHTEICRKFRPQSAQEMIEDANMEVARFHTDANGWFSIVEAVKRT